MMQYRIGDILPASHVRGIAYGPDILPVWHCLIVRSNSEASLRARFRANDVYTFYPSESRFRHVRGKRIESERPIITGQLYAQFRQAPQWDVIRERGMALGVHCIAGVPVRIPVDVIRHLQGLTVEAERLIAARAELLRVRAGDRATISDGPLAGFMVEVEQVSNGEAWFKFLTGGKGRASVRTLERDLPKIPVDTIVTRDYSECIGNANGSNGNDDGLHKQDGFAGRQNGRPD